jgi:hypothetical protein
METELRSKTLHLDRTSRRLWIRGQRCHHGATGALLASAGMVALMGLRVRPLAGLVAAGGLLMAHDWKDRSVWFARGWQD